MKKILIIEDDSLLSENISLLLNLSGYNVYCANDGKSGVETALRELPDLILCDIKMPNLDGYGVLHILSNHPKTATIPFIFLSGSSEPDNLRKGMTLGADDYLVKPFNEVDLLNTIKTRLQKNEMHAKQLHSYTESQNGLDQDFFDIEQSKLIRADHEIVHYKKKHILYEIGQRPLFLYYITEGKIKEFLINSDGKELITGIYGKGDFFGFTEIFKESNYLKKSQVLEDVSLILIPKEDFLSHIYTDVSLAKKFIKLMSQNISDNEEMILNMAYNSLRKKVAQGIIKLIDKFNETNQGKHIIDISREDLSNIIGASQESMIRTLKEFKLENLIEVGNNGHIVVLDEKKLRFLKY
ncbi:transcriptional regulator, Crp/Fnr family [Pseudopedobacter saltans DSM 12145]|uniref:Transcriptional regulator, Crp/Fnr family n=1 Tax=Pseudopedobacter saltans (strain ATCC 51119 / DSM 12145 / JCM 21818 / CCUG 39354 / LMG 10337 / NBRC 100064 / NCIMB 13643) TaxID=762903 RepID=F0S9Q4_PSESL|nr:response regulator [Pseudopedobacter saltans]ADY51410.1 transcriptional regulator, Crp/Fnr family [Pseudopedobacter saltans DSM 12145]